MSNQEPDGWVSNSQFLDETGHHHFKRLYLYGEVDDDDVPVMLISPQELTRLRAIEEWAKEMWKRLNTIACGMQSPIDSAHADMLCQQYDALNAPVEGEK